MIGCIDPPEIGAGLGLARGLKLPKVDGFIDMPVSDAKVGVTDTGDSDGIESDDESGAEDIF